MLYNDEKNLRPEPDRGPTPKDEWELDRDRIVTGDVLGEGAFGRVLKGTLAKDRSTTTVEVAIKMLKGARTNFPHRCCRKGVTERFSLGVFQTTRAATKSGTCTRRWR